MVTASDSRGSGRGPRRAGVPAATVMAVVAAAAGAFFLGGEDFCLDDAWIHLDYVKSLRLGEGLSYNPHDWETGASSPLWVLLLAAAPVLAHPVVVVKLIGLALHAAGAALAALCAAALCDDDRGRGGGRGAAGDGADGAVDGGQAEGRAGGDGGGHAGRSDGGEGRAALAAVVAGALTATCPPLLQGATSGMEVSLASALLLGAVLATLRARPGLACALGLLAELARPESLFFLGAFAVGLAVLRRAARPAAAAVGAAAGLALWMGYDLLVSGYAFPNTQYVKGSGAALSGLGYLTGHVVPALPVFAGVGGAAAIAMACVSAIRRRRPEVPALFVGWLACVAAVAVSRRLPDVLFYAERYFTVVAAVPAVLAGVGVVRAPRWLQAVLLVPVLVVTVLLVRDRLTWQRAQERGIRLLHSDVGRYAAGALPADAVIAVEGAGAIRFFTPRTMTIVDVLGLNARAIAHARDSRDIGCALIHARPTHAVLPDDFVAEYGKVLGMKVERVFTDPAYAQGEDVHERRVLLMSVLGARRGWAAACPP